MKKYVHKEMRRLMGKGIHEYGMTEDGDNILVSVSGGKDSMSLLWLLRERIKRLPIDYNITAVHVDPGFGSDNSSRMEAFFREHGFNYEIITGNFGPKAHSSENLENPCFLCSRLRRKHVFEVAAKLNCNKIAMGHHKDDMIETFFLNIFYGGSVSTMMPVQDFFNGTIKVIRPLFMIDEKLVAKYAVDMGFPKIRVGCPTSGNSKRGQLKKMLQGLYMTNRKIKGNVFHALRNVNPEYLP